MVKDLWEQERSDRHKEAILMYRVIPSIAVRNTRTCTGSQNVLYHNTDTQLEMIDLDLTTHASQQ